jgi:AraC-like DNA-binding protein
MSIIVYHKSEDKSLGIVCGRGVSKRFPAHRHKSVSLGMVLKGSRLLTIQQTKYVIAEGDVFIINSEESHSIGETQDAEHDYIVVSLTPKHISRHSNEGLPLFENIVGSRVLAENLGRLFCFLIQKSEGPIPVDWSVLISEMYRFRKNESVEHCCDKRLEKVKAILDHSVSDSHSLAELAGEAAISEFHFSRMFKNYTGLAPHQYLLDNRLRFAREMLEAGMSVSDVAIAAGFYDNSHFIRHFSGYYCVSPSDFQKGIRKLSIE